MSQFKATDSEIKPYPLCLGNCTVNNMKKTGLKGSAQVLSVDYNVIDTNDIHRYLMKET